MDAGSTAAARDGGEPVCRVAERYGVSRQWAHELVRRWRREGEAGLLPRSRAARRVANRTDPALAARVVALRERLAGEGLDAGARSIAARLHREGVNPPAPSTIHRILRDAGLVAPEPRKRPRSSYVRFEAGLPNELWQSDFTHWPLTAVSDALVLSWLDDHSRYLLYTRAFASITMGTVEDSFLDACREHGVPAGILTDNGTVYTTRLVGAEPGHFQTTLALMGVRQHNGRPYHPQTQGKIERWHRTLKQWLSARPLAPSLDALNGQLDEFRRIYNEERPHRALERRTPGEAYRARGKAGPDPELAARARTDAGGRGPRADAPADTATGPRAAARPRHAAAHAPQAPDVDLPARTRRLDGNGTVKTRNIAGAPRTFTAGRANAGRPVILAIDHGQVTITDAGTGEILVDQPLDPTRNYQPIIPHPTVNHDPGQK